MENNKNLTGSDDRLQKDNPTINTKDLEEGKKADLSGEVKQTPPEKPDFMPGAEENAPAATQAAEAVPPKSDSGNDEKTAVKQTPPEAGERPKENPENTAKPADDNNQAKQQSSGTEEDSNSELQKNLDAARRVGKE